jgi:predicted transcriptional regulator
MCRKPQPKTRVMLKTNLSYKTLKKYLNKMLRLNLIEVHHSQEKYLTTEKGYEFPKLCIELQRLFETDENPERLNPDSSRLLKDHYPKE